MAERRRYRRVPFHCRATVAPRPDGATLLAWCFDLSRGGVLLAVWRPLPPRQRVAVAFHLQDDAGGAVNEVAEGVVVRAEAEGTRLTYGVEFLEPLDDARHPLLVREFDRA